MELSTDTKPKKEKRSAKPLFAAGKYLTVSTTLPRLIAGGIFGVLLFAFLLWKRPLFWNIASGVLLWWIAIGIALFCTAVTALRFGLSPRISNAVSTVIALASPLLSILMVETLNQVNIFTKWSFFKLWTSYALYLLFYAVIYVCSGSYRLAVIIANSLFFAIALTNYYVMAFRGTPFVPMDFLAAETAANVANTYDFSFTEPIVLALMIFIGICIVGFKLRTPKMPLVWKVASRVFFGVLTACTILLYFFTDIYANAGLRPDFWNQARGYRNSGVIMNFCLNFKYMYVSAPAGYDPDGISGIIYDMIGGDADVSTAADTPDDGNTEEGGEETPAPVKATNVICIMNESLADLSVLGEEDVNMDYLPFIRSLTENTVRGNLYVPVIGSGTSNTEYEFLTGVSMSFFPAGSNAYMAYVKDSVFSMVSTMKGLGFYRRAFHPYYASGWNRRAVYTAMHFNRFTSLGAVIPQALLTKYQQSGYDPEYFNDIVNEANPGEQVLLRGFVSDACDYHRVISMYESHRASSDKPYFMFNVTMQNHGGYTDTFSNFDQEVWVTGVNGRDAEYWAGRGVDITTVYPKTNQFYSLMKKSDEAFEELIDYFSGVEEPTVICIFGDHQPNIESDYIARLLGVKHLEDASIEQTQKRYITPFLIWANYDIEEETVERLSSNYLSSYVMKVAGLDMPAYNQYLLKLSEKVPVIDTAGYIDAQGNCYEFGSTTALTPLIEDYKKVMYNGFFDKKNCREELFTIAEE